MTTVFWNVDTQHDFMRNDSEYQGKLAIAGAQEIENNLERITKLAKEKNMRVVNTADWHTSASREISATPNFRTTFPEHCMQDTKGAMYIPATNPENPYVVSWQDKTFDAQKVRDHRNIVIYKDEFDVFHKTGAPHTEKILDIIKPTTAVVYGVATNVCVNDAVLGLAAKGINVYVVKDAIKELPDLPVETIYDAWKNAGVKYTTTESLLFYITREE